MMWHKSSIFTAAILAMALAGFFGCEKQENPVGNEVNLEQIEEQSGIVEDPGAENPKEGRAIDVLGASMSIAWPMGPNENPNNWEGDQNNPPRTNGAWITGYGWTHQGADYYARDLNQPGWSDNGKSVYAGFAGEVIMAGTNGGYGNCVVIYDEGRHVAVRYAHLSAIVVSVGQWVQIRQHIGNLGNTGLSFGPHLHLSGYENVNDNNGNPIIPTASDSNYYACIIYFFC